MGEPRRAVRVPSSTQNSRSQPVHRIPCAAWGVGQRHSDRQGRSPPRSNGSGRRRCCPRCLGKKLRLRVRSAGTQRLVRNPRRGRNRADEPCPPQSAPSAQPPPAAPVRTTVVAPVLEHRPLGAGGAHRTAADPCPGHGPSADYTSVKAAAPRRRAAVRAGMSGGLRRGRDGCAVSAGGRRSLDCFGEAGERLTALPRPLVSLPAVVIAGTVTHFRVTARMVAGWSGVALRGLGQLLHGGGVVLGRQHRGSAAYLDDAVESHMNMGNR